MRTDTPVQFKLAEYKPFPFAIDRVDLRFILHPDTTRVLARLEIRRTGPGDLRLDGVGLELKAIAIDAKPLPREAYILSEDSLRLTHVPDTFELTTEVEITPSHNTELSGQYMSGGRF